jgi:hypothetical protein
MNKEKVIEILINDFGWVSIEKGDDLVIEMMQDTIEATKKAFSLTDVSQQRELLEGFVDWFNANDKTQAILSERIEEYLKTL